MKKSKFIRSKAKNKATSLNLNSQFGKWGGYVIISENNIDAAESACRGGVRIIQYREKNANRRQILITARKLRRIVSNYDAIFIVNDYIDIAILVKADGVHLGQDDIPIGDARSLVPKDFIIGISTHSIEQAKTAEAEGADYIGIGPVFNTFSKPEYKPIGIKTVCDVIDTVHIPIVAIGGINLENINQLINIDATNVAMIGGFAKNTEITVRQVNSLLINK